MTQYFDQIEGRKGISVPKSVAKIESTLRDARNGVFPSVVQAEFKYGEEKDGKVLIEICPGILRSSNCPAAPPKEQ